MKTTLLYLLAIPFLLLKDGPKIYTNGVVTTLTEVKQSEFAESSVSDAESITTLKDDMLKIVTTSVTNLTTVIIDRKKNTAKTYSTVMGAKIGFEMTIPNAASEKAILTLIDSSKTLNGYHCKKAILSLTNPKAEAVVWYSTEIKFSDINMGISLPGIEKLPGFPIKTSFRLPQGYFVESTVTKIDLTVSVPGSAFVGFTDYTLYNTVEEFQKKVKEISTGGHGQ